MYSINFQLLADRILPWFLRKPTTRQWLYALLKPLQDINDVFLAWRIGLLYELSITGQVIYLEKLLNDKFNGGLPAYTGGSADLQYIDGTPSGIYITDPSGNFPIIYLWNKIELRPAVYLRNLSEGEPPVYFYNKADYDANIEFVVNVPTAVGDVVGDALFISKMRAWIEKYRIAGKRYKLINY